MPFTSKEKAFCVLEYARTQSPKTVQCAFFTNFAKKAPTTKQIRTWHQKFQEKGCLCIPKSPGQPSTSAETVEQVREAFLRSTRKSVRRASTGTHIPQTTVWRILRKRLRFKPYKLQLVQALREGDKRKRKEFCVEMLDKLDEDDFDDRLVFSDEATFHTSGKVNKHNVRIWGKENPHGTVEHERDSTKVDVFCAISKKKVYGPFFFEGNVNGDVYLQMLQNWLIDQLIENEDESLIFQQDGAPPHWKLTV